MQTRAQKLAALQAAADRKAAAKDRREGDVLTALSQFDNEARDAAKKAGIKIPDHVNFVDFVADAKLGVSKAQILAAIAPDKSKPNWKKNQEIALQNPLVSVPSLINKISGNPDQAFSTAIKTSIQASGNDPKKPSTYVQAAQQSNLSANVINSATSAGNSALQTQTKALGSLTGGHGIVTKPKSGLEEITDTFIAPVLHAGEDIIMGAGDLMNDVAHSPLGGLIIQAGLAYCIPIAGEALAAELGVSNTVGTAMVNVGVQVAQGKSFEDAVKSVGTGLLIDTGSQFVAKEFNTVINNPNVTNAVVSAGASAVKTAVAGGTKEDILKSAGASLAGSGVYGLTGSKVAGAAASGAIKGGLTGAAMGAAGALASSSTAPKTTTPTTATPPFVPEKTAEASPLDSTKSTSADPGIKVAGGDDASALHMAGISAMPEMLGKSNETASPLSATTDEGETFYQRIITGKTPDGKEYSYTATYDPAKNEVFYTTSGITQDEEGNVIPSGGAGASASITRPDFSPKVETTPSLPSNVQLNDEPYDPIDYSVKADYSLGSTATPKFGVDPMTGTGLTANPMTNGAADVGYTPVDYGLVGANAGLGLQMPSSPAIKAMGGGQGLTTNVTNPVTGETGVVSGLGYTPTGAAPVLGNPSSFINNPSVTGQPVMAVDPAYSNDYTPNIKSSPLITANQKPAGSSTKSSAGSVTKTGTGTNTGSGLSLGAGELGALTALESYLTTTGDTTPFELAQLKQLFPELTPDMAKILMERVGVTPSMLANPNFLPPETPASVNSDQDPNLSAVELANFGQPDEYTQYAAKGGSMRLPKGHHPEFITGQTGHYAQGRGTGQSDDIPAVLHDGDYVVDADTVAAFGDGSSKAGAGALEHFRRSIPEHHSGGGQPIPAKIADGEYVLPAGFVTSLGRGSNKQGAKMLDAMREQIRAHKRSAPDTKIPPKAKSPLQYMNEAMKG